MDPYVYVYGSSRQPYFRTTAQTTQCASSGVVKAELERDLLRIRIVPVRRRPGVGVLLPKGYMYSYGVGYHGPKKGS